MTRNSGRAAALLLLRRSGTALCEDTDEFLPSPHPMVEPSTVEALDLDSDMPPFPDGGDHHVVPSASNGLEVGLAAADRPTLMEPTSLSVFFAAGTLCDHYALAAEGKGLSMLSLIRPRLGGGRLFGATLAAAVQLCDSASLVEFESRD